MLNQTAIVFGGSGGIGRAICLEFARLGATVVAIGRNSSALDEVLKNLPTTSDQEHSILNCDVTDTKNISQVLDFINKKYEKVNHLVNAFGINSDSLLVRQPDSDIYKTINSNLIGTINTCKAFTKLFLSQKHGSIVNISSIVGQHGNIGQTVYSASKAGVIAFSKSLAKEIGPKNIRVNVICPGYINTNMTKSIYICI
ncbi:hypothetical protein BB560_000682 [Smittium megazygosporum]|uniref:3-oxoacyl-[acyl-carrier-protein] reductase n=1 Tax=Smittium megazygosporum TaxID=133381 RepID=A0A2T9ZJP2_9FUNG|nr:hypothetical protein BB560_000682 [Smittium megazygosporum]